jgi:hypothetical protein
MLNLKSAWGGNTATLPGVFYFGGDLGLEEFRSSGVQEFRSSEVQKFRSSEVQEYASGTLREQEWKSARRKQQSHELFCNSCNFCLLLGNYSVTPATSVTSVFFFLREQKFKIFMSFCKNVG